MVRFCNRFFKSKTDNYLNSSRDSPAAKKLDIFSQWNRQDGKIGQSEMRKSSIALQQFSNTSVCLTYVDVQIPSLHMCRTLWLYRWGRPKGSLYAQEVHYSTSLQGTPWAVTKTMVCPAVVQFHLYFYFSWENLSKLYCLNGSRKISKITSRLLVQSYYICV
jgi:hypothetical protein